MKCPKCGCDPVEAGALVEIHSRVIQKQTGAEVLHLTCPGCKSRIVYADITWERRRALRAAFAKCRAALTMADVTLPPCDCHAWGTRKPPCPTCKARRSIKAARTAMDKAQGRSK